MDDGRATRLGARASLLVGGVLVVAAFAGADALQSLDDAADAQYAAYARVSGALDGVDRRPSRHVASATGRAVERLTEAGIPARDAAALSELYSTWMARPRDEAALGALRDRTAAVGEDISRRQNRTDLVTLALTALVLAGLAGTGLLLLRRTSVRHRRLAQTDRPQQHDHGRDPLTGLADRRLFHDRLTDAAQRHLRRSEPLAVLVCDIDDFKDVNDCRGHAVGDRLLVELAARLVAELDPADTVGRIGGDEFAILLGGRDAEGAQQVAQRVLTRLAEPLLVDDTAFAIRASIGVAASPADDTDPDALLRDAVVAMGWAKDRGKSGWARYEADLHSLARDRAAVRSELQAAVREHQLVLHYQPTVDLTTETITGFEALVRWQHPTRGLLAPQSFIALAEESGLIVELGSWVLREACHAAAGLQTASHRPTMSVNVAAQQVVQDDFVDRVVESLEDSGLDPACLVLEITESVLLDDLAGAVERLAELREIGVHVAIDDFGTGYSSLAYLSKLPVDILKVDKTFVDDVGEDPEGASVVEAIFAMSRTMHLTTVAEGVELPEQAAWLRSAACTMGQGYLWSRPVSLARAQHLLRAGIPRQRNRYAAHRPRHAAPWPAGGSFA